MVTAFTITGYVLLYIRPPSFHLLIRSNRTMRICVLIRMNDCVARFTDR